MTETMLVIFGLVVGFYLGALVMALMADRRVDEERARCQRLHPAQFRSKPVVTSSTWTATNDGVTVNVEPVE